MMALKNIKYLLLMLCFTSLTSSNIFNKNYIISTPRSELVRFLRWLTHYGKVIHIPANLAYCYDLGEETVKSVEGWYKEDASKTYSEAKDVIVSEAENSDVFVGENTHTAIPFLKANPDLVDDPFVQFLVLMRQPHGSIIDYYKQKEKIFGTLSNQQIDKSIGLEGLYNLLVELKESGRGIPLIISAEDLCNKTKETTQKVCDYLKIPFEEESLEWKNISKDFTTFNEALNWNSIENTKTSLDWHSKAIESTGFAPLPVYAVDEKGNPTFEEIENINHRDICRKAYEENMKFYDKIQKMVIE